MVVRNVVVVSGGEERGRAEREVLCFGEGFEEMCYEMSLEGFPSFSFMNNILLPVTLPSSVL